MAVKQVIIKGDPIYKEAIANESITPGDLIEFIGGSAATASYVKKHATAAGNQGGMFAVVQDYIGGGLTKTYASGDQVIYVAAGRGDEINARLAANNNALVGSLLESNGDGTLRLHTPASAASASNYLNKIVGQAMDPVNSGSTARVRVEVI